MVYFVLVGLAVIIGCVFAGAPRRGSGSRVGSPTDQPQPVDLHHHSQHGFGIDGSHYGHHYGGGHHGYGGMHHP